MHAHSRQWAGKSLPSALQWEKAALGTTGTVFSWGDQKRQRSATFERPASARRPPSFATTAGSRRTASTTWLATSGSGAQRTPTRGRDGLKGTAFTSPVVSR